MKTDRKLLVAIFILIGLVSWLVVLSLDRSEKVNRALKEIETIRVAQLEQPKVIKGVDGYTPVLGVDYFNGSDGTPGAQGVQGIPGAKGEKGDKGDPAPTIIIDCIKGKISKKVFGDTLWESSNVDCGNNYD